MAEFIKASNAELRKLPVLHQLNVQDLASHLSHSNGVTRDMAQRILVEKSDLSVAENLRKLVKSNSDNYGWLHAAWTLHGLGALDTDTVSHLLTQQKPEMINAGLEFVLADEHLSLRETVGKLITSPQTVHAHLKALAHFGFHEQGLKLVKEHSKQARVHQAFLAGLSDETLTAMANNPQTDKQLLDLLKYKKTATNTVKINSLNSLNSLTDQAKESYQRGKAVYAAAACNGCHGAEGTGVNFLGPPLASSEWVTKDPKLLTKILLKGLQGPLTVNGKKYNPPAAMPAMGHFSDQQLADVMTYIRHSWGNSAKPVSPKTVKRVRAKTASQTQAYTAADIQP